MVKQEIKFASSEIKTIKSDMPRELGALLVYLMKWRKISNIKLSERTLIDESTISRIRSGKREEPSLQKMIAICCGLELPYPLSQILIEAAGHKLQCSKKHTYYEHFLLHKDAYTIYDMNQILIDAGFEPLVKEK